MGGRVWSEWLGVRAGLRWHAVRGAGRATHLGLTGGLVGRNHFGVFWVIVLFEGSLADDGRRPFAESADAERFEVRVNFLRGLIFVGNTHRVVHRLGLHLTADVIFFRYILAAARLPPLFFE